MSLNVSLIKNVILVIVLLIMAFTTLAETSADVANAADEIQLESDTWPLVTFFKKKGVVLLALVAGIVITIISAVLPTGRK